MQNFWYSLGCELQLDRQVLLVLVADHTSGSPGTTGSKMWISETGKTCGTIGGGVMEYNAIERAQEILQQPEFTPTLQTLYHRRDRVSDKSGMMCAGSQTNLYYLCRPETETNILEQIVSILVQDLPASLSIAPTGMSISTSALDLDRPPIQLLQAAGTWRYTEQLLNRHRIAIVGGGHCALALSKVMEFLGYEVLVFETRHAVATLTQNTYARSIQVVADYQVVGELIPYPQLTSVVVMTTNVNTDISAVRGVIDFPFPLIGVMGSRAKIEYIWQQLRQGGVSEALLSTLKAPVGLPIGSHTPEEIAISISAQIIQFWNRK